MSDIGSIADRASDCQPCPARLPLGLLTRGTSPSLRSNRTVPAKRNHPCGSFITALYPKDPMSLPQRPYVFTPKTSPLYSKDLTFLNKTAPLPRYYGLGPTPRFAFASTRSPKLLSELSTRVPPMPRRVSSAQVSSAESCWLHNVRTMATRNFSNETLRRRFTCVVAYSFVWRDSRTSVTLCTPHRPNCMLTSLQCRLLSAELCSAYLTLKARNRLGPGWVMSAPRQRPR